MQGQPGDGTVRGDLHHAAQHGRAVRHQRRPVRTVGDPVADQHRRALVLVQVPGQVRAERDRKRRKDEKIVSDARATMTPTSARAAYSDVVVKSTARKRSAGGSRIQETW